MPKQAKMTRAVSIAELRTRYSKASDGRIRQRLLMLIHVKEGTSATKTGNMVKVSKNTVTKWVERFNVEGFEGLEDKDRSGRPPIIDYDNLRNVIDNQSPQDYGYPHQAWFPRLLYQYLIDHQNLEGTPFEYIYEVIDRAGYVLRVPRSKHYKSDDHEVEFFKKK